MTTPKRFAANTKVEVDRSQAELCTLLRKHGANQVAVAFQEKGAAVVFALGGRHVRLEVPIPGIEAILADGKKRQPRVGNRAWWQLGDTQRRQWADGERAQLERSRWRTLILITKAKLELVHDGLSTIEREFLADILLPDGSRVGEWLAPKLRLAYESGDMAPLLPARSDDP